MQRVRHKGENRFQFEPFNERIKKIKIDVVHTVPHKYEEEASDNYSHFYIAIQKWATLNLTKKWTSIKRKLDHIQTLEQVIHNKDKIISLFLEQIKWQDEASLGPLLELITALVKDLRQEVFPFYPLIIKELFQLLNSKDPDILEAIFSCAAHVFKYLHKQIVKELDKVLLDLAPLLNDSNPEYVREFAAQSFAFVARKVKDRNKLLSLVLFAVQSSPELLDGCAQLVFEMMRGISNQSHSCSEEILSVLLDSIGENDIPQKTHVSLTKRVVKLYVNNIDPEYSVFFKVIFEVIMGKLQKENLRGLPNLLKIVRKGLSAKEGRHLSAANLTLLVKTLMCLFSLDENIQKQAALVCSDLLTSKDLKLSQESVVKVIGKVFNMTKTSALLRFIDETSRCAGFEAYILERALTYFCSLNDIIFLPVLTKIACEKAVTPKKFNEFEVYPLKLTGSSESLFDFVVDILQNFQAHDPKTVVYCLVLLRHIQPVDFKLVFPYLKTMLKSAMVGISESGDNLLTNFFILCNVFETLVFMKKGGLKVKGLHFEELCEVLLTSLQHSKSILALKGLDLLLTLSKGHVRLDTVFSDLRPTIEEWLLCPQSNARCLALHCIQTMEKTKPGSASKKMVEILQAAIDAEIIPLTIADYREKIKLWDKLNVDGAGSFSNSQYSVFLKYLLGALYSNFSLVWEPIIQIIAGYSIEMPGDSFWEVFYGHLRTATANCQGMAPSYNYNLPDFDDFLINSMNFIKAEEKEVHSTYRNHLWTAMTSFSDLCEKRNRDVITIYLQFIRDVILKCGSEHKSTINIQQRNSTELNESQNLDESTEEENKSNEGHGDDVTCALTQLQLLSKFKNPTQCHREAEVRWSYLELLLHRDFNIQKMALECYFTFKLPSVAPYKQKLRNLMDEKKFKNELVHFQINADSGVVKDIHREEVMKIVMRILYRKMLSRASAARGNRGSASLSRRSNIMRFLAGSSNSEMQVFFQMAFKSFVSYSEGAELDFHRIMNSINLSEFPPPRKLQNTVNLAETVVKSFGGLLSVELQRFIFKVVVHVGCTVGTALQRRDEVHFGYLNSLRNTRTACFDVVNYFFERFHQFPWSEADIDAVFHVFIWPVLPQLPVEAVHSPTGLLRMFSVWSKEPRYFQLLARHHQQDEILTPLPFIMQLLLNERSRPPVINCIISILENLVTLNEEEFAGTSEQEEPPPPLHVKFLLPLQEAAIKNLQLKEPLNYGSKMLFPHVADILKFLHRKLKETSKLGKANLTVLSRITEMASSPEHGDALMSLLLKFMSSSRRPADDDLLNMVFTLENLTNVVPDPSIYLRSLAVLFGTVELLQARKVLVSLLSNVGRRCPDLEETAAIVRDLNAWDPRWVEQPNFHKRLDALKTIRTVIETEDFSVDLAFIALHNCFYFVRCETDLSLVDSASFCLSEICPRVANFFRNKSSIRSKWIESILNLTKAAIVSDNENYQTLAVSVLGVMASNCGDMHPVLKDLSILSRSEDPEVDFFENAQHLQIYRRLRALNRFAKVAKTLRKAPTTRTLTQFILPLAEKYLCSEKYFVGSNTMVDSAIEAVKIACKFLPWREYKTTLQFYSSKLRSKPEFQRQMIRIVTAVLAAFHFDISLSPGVPQGEGQNDSVTTAVSVREETMEAIPTERLNETTNRMDESGGNNEEREDSRVEGEVSVNETTDGMDESAVSSEGGEEKRGEGGAFVNEGEAEDGIEEVGSAEQRFGGAEPEGKGSTAEEEMEVTESIEGNETEAMDVEDKTEGASEVQRERTSEEEVEKKGRKSDGETENVEEEVGGEDADEEDSALAVNVVTPLSAKTAQNVEKTISGPVLKELYRVLEQKSEVDDAHRLNQKRLAGEKAKEECMRIPVAFVVVQLLQKLPERMLDAELSRVILTCCMKLRSRTQSVRRTTRDTLKAIAASLGPKYLNLIFSLMSTVLTKGFQLHVLVLTMHGIAEGIQGQLRPGDIDENLTVLLEACKMDLFGPLSEEKEVPQLAARNEEVRATKSYLLLKIISQFVTEKRLTDVIMPVKEVLQTSYSHKNLVKCREYLRNVVLGIMENTFISKETLYIYVYGTTSEAIPGLMPNLPQPPKKKNPREKKDCFILAPEPKTNTGVSSNPAKKNSKTSSHIIVEFGLNLLNGLLKKHFGNENKDETDFDIRKYLDPIVPVLTKVMKSQNIKISAIAVDAFAKVIRFDLPSLNRDVKRVMDILFGILHKFGASGLCKGENFDLVVAAFKAVNTLVREIQHLSLTEDQLKTLLLYTEQDIHDTTRQATAFALLKTILRKKLYCPELHDVITKVAQLSITSHLQHIRTNARETVLRYMTDYPLKEKLTPLINFYLAQVRYQVESGRQSSLEMCKSLISAFSETTLSRYCQPFFLTLSAQLLNDDSPECKEMICGMFETLFSRLGPAGRDSLVGNLLRGMENSPISHRMLGAQLAGTMVQVEEGQFIRHLPALLPLLQKQFDGHSRPGNYVRLPGATQENRDQDHHSFQVLQLLLKICEKCPDFLTSHEFQKNVQFFTETCQIFLQHPHDWVRIAASKFINLLLSSIQPSDVVAVLNGRSVNSNRFFLEPKAIQNRIKSLVLDYCAQLVPGVEINQEMIDQVVKALVYFAEVLMEVTEGEAEPEEAEEEEEDDDRENRRPLVIPSFIWLVRSVRRVVNREVVQHPGSTTVRTAAFQWTSAVLAKSSRSQVKKVLYHLMAPVVREREMLESENREGPFKTLVMELCGALKRKVGQDAYNREAVKIKRLLMEKRVQRRSERAQEFVTDPEAAARKKMRRQIKKKESRKRKLQMLRERMGFRSKRRRNN